MLKKTGSLLLLALLCITAAQADELEIIQLGHRSADEVLPIIRPMLDQDGVASGMGYQLFLRTSPRNLAQIKQMIASLDKAPRRLVISVMQDVDSVTLARMTDLSGGVGVGRDARISVPGGGQQRGLNVELEQGRDRLNAQVISTRELAQDHKVQQIQVLEGNRALVSSGLSVAVPQRQVIRNQWGTQVNDSVQYRDVSSGFYVLPRITGERVMVEIQAQNDSLGQRYEGQQATQVQRVSTTVSGRLGEWLVVGGVAQQQVEDENTISVRGTEQGHEQRNVLIKVEALQ